MTSSVGLSAYRALAFLVHRAPLPAGALAHSMSGRRAAGERWVAWGSDRPAGPLIWIHGASVGELIGAGVLVPRLRGAIAGAQFMYTHSSPSAGGWPLPGNAPLDYVPTDEPDAVRQVLAAVRPSLLVYSCGDVWPELTHQAARAGIPTAVAGARMRPSSLRSSGAARLVLKRVYGELSFVGARSAEDGERWIRAGAAPERVTVTGDPRHDQALERLPDLGPIAPILAWARGRRVLLAASTEASDEPMLIRAAPRLLAGGAHRMLVVPHEPSEARIAAWQDACRRTHVPCSSWRSGESPPQTPVVIVRQTGLLFDLYAAAAVAYVGGGFKRGRVHAVAEPAAWALPVIVGSAAGDDHDVAMLGRGGGVAVLPEVDPESELSRKWRHWADSRRAQAAGLENRGALGAGAAARTVQALAALVDSAATV